MKFPLHVADVLQTAGDIVAHIGWTKHTFARNASGEGVSVTNKEAECFCAMGAVQLARSLAGRKYPEHIFYDALTAGQNNIVSIPAWNDARVRTQEEVSEAFYAAAERIREQHG